MSYREFLRSARLDVRDDFGNPRASYRAYELVLQLDGGGVALRLDTHCPHEGVAHALRQLADDLERSVAARAPR